MRKSTRTPCFDGWYRGHSVYVPSQWEMVLHCNTISHWLGAYSEWSLQCWHPDNDVTIQVQENTQPIIHGHAWQCYCWLVDGHLSRSFGSDGICTVKFYLQKLWQIHPMQWHHWKSYHWFVHDGLKKLGKKNSSWERAPIFLIKLRSPKLHYYSFCRVYFCVIFLWNITCRGAIKGPW